MLRLNQMTTYMAGSTVITQLLGWTEGGTSNAADSDGTSSGSSMECWLETDSAGIDYEVCEE